MSKKVTQMSPLHDGKEKVVVSLKEDENMIEAIEDL